MPRHKCVLRDVVLYCHKLLLKRTSGNCRHFHSGNVSLSKGGTIFKDLPKASIISGKHSDQGSMIPEIRQDLRSRNKISGHSDRVLAQNFDTVIADIVIWAGDIIFAKFCQEV